MKSFISKQKIFYFFLILLTSYIIACCKLGKVVEINEDVDPGDIASSGEVYKIYSDLHIFSKKSRHPDFTYGENTFYIGDIYDLKCAENKENCRRKINELRHRAGLRYIRGNHELDHFKDAPYHHIQNGILFTHGHKNICFSDYKVRKNEENGNTGLLSKVHSFLTSIPFIVDKRRVARAVDYAKANDCHTIVFGHTHKTLFDRTYETDKGNIRVINVPRGVTYLNIPRNRNFGSTNTPGSHSEDKLIS